jgi:uncharacterized protein YwgA
LGQVFEAEKLLFTFYEAEKLNITICTEKINPYVFLMCNRYKIPIYYPFRFNPVPYSEELVDDMESLKRAGHITYSSPIAITQKGKARVEQRLDDFLFLSENIEKTLKELSKWDDKLLFQAIYDTITS